ncbi:MAG TPA: DNA polymerase IV, partial [Acidimicrobiia bacterium]|nr:DNA polymerase IV [Acidimicrobiia bacterium]
MPGAATILHADLDAFYAAVEVRDRPDLRGRPVAVGGGVILSATYEARAWGVHAPMGGRSARTRCPQLVIVPPHFERYVAASDQVMEILRRFTPLVEPISIDEAFLDVTGSTHLFGSPTEIATAIRRLVAAEVGLPISVGVATTKHLAKVASRVAKPDGLRVVAPGEEADFLAPLPVGHLWGVGPVGEQRLARYGIRTIGELLEADPAALAGWFGEHNGRHLGDMASNRDHRSVRSGPSRAGSVGAQSAGDASDPHTRDRVLLGLAERVGYRMRRRGVAGSRITVHVRFSDQSRVSRSLLLPGPVAETTSLFRAAAALTHALVGERARGRGVTLVALSMDRLRTAEYLQLEMPLGTGPADPALRAGSVQHARLRALDGAADRARSRFGRDAVRRAALLKDHPEERSPATAIASLEEG